MTYIAVWALYIPDVHLDAFVEIWREAKPIYEQHGIREPSMLQPVAITAENYGCGPLASCLRTPGENEVLLLGLDRFESREDCDRIMASTLTDERLQNLSARTEPIFGADYSSSLLRGEYVTIE
jgi:uncharacterized protein YbaA (DUF1428 family)